MAENLKPFQSYINAIEKKLAMRRLDDMLQAGTRAENVDGSKPVAKI